MKKSNLFVTRAALIAAFYVILGALSNILGLDSGILQLRLSEMLCVLPAVYGSAVWGVTVGCFIFNTIFTGSVIDMIFGTFATLIGALLAALFKKHRYFAFIPSVISNAIIIPFVICYGAMDRNTSALPIMFIGVGIGELISCGVLGSVLLKALEKRKLF